MMTARAFDRAYFVSRLIDWLFYPLVAAVSAAIGYAVVYLFYLVVITVAGPWNRGFDPMFPLVAILSAIFGVREARRERRDPDPARDVAEDAKALQNRVLTAEEEAAIGRRKMFANSLGFELTGPTGTYARQWDDARIVMSTHDRFYALFDVVVLIPKRAFDTETEFRQFVGCVDRWSGQGRNPTGPALPSENSVSTVPGGQDSG